MVERRNDDYSGTRPHRPWLLLVVFMAFSGCVSSNKVSQVATLCENTRYPRLCVDSLSGLTGGGDVHSAAAALLNQTIYQADLPFFEFDKFSSHFVSSHPKPTLRAIGFCNEMMEMSRQRLNQAMTDLKESPEKQKQDIQTWLSAVVTFQQACKDSVDTSALSSSSSSNTKELLATISHTVSFHSQLASNALSLVNRMTEDVGGGISGRGISGRQRKLLQSASDRSKADVVVAKDGTGNYKTVSEAVQSVPGGRRFVIYVKSGVYKENIHISKDGVTLIGDGKYSTIITGDSSVGGGSSLQGSATFVITGDGFVAKDIGFENAAGPEAQQAVALLVASDRSVFYRCSISGYQDTLYAFSFRQFYRECDISGTVDFIFGNAAAVFQACNLVLRRPASSQSYNVILANGRSDPGQSTGFSVQNCKITVGSDFSSVKNTYLGRAWREYSRAVVIESDIGGAISERGWIEWPGSSSSSLGKLYFGEYANVGARAGLGGRVNWPGFHSMAREEADKFTVEKFIIGNSWLPSTGVSFVSGL
ncbi:unnamed protein product [Cuscuta epithymum]|uniref:Pectinesterase n=1 Tax=Cuscuta epithymum TaxID=186058 RepID=A0AAV0E268_9ASTE|nr:unnamed protein product [Cuscuta epithymum]